MLRIIIAIFLLLVLQISAIPYDEIKRNSSCPRCTSRQCDDMGNNDSSMGSKPTVPPSNVGTPPTGGAPAVTPAPTTGPSARSKCNCNCIVNGRLRPPVSRFPMDFRPRPF